MSDSTSIGFLAPVQQDAYDDELTDTLQAAVVGIAGIPGALVRPRWQKTVPVMPNFDQDWCALGLTRKKVESFAYDRHIPEAEEGAGQSAIERDEELIVLHSFYGPNAGAYAERFRDGFEISQNRDVLRQKKLMFVEAGEAITLPSKVQEFWVQRVDVEVRYRRRTSRTYQVRTIAEGQLGIDNERYVTPIIATQQ